MANYKLVDADALDSNLTTIADAIRERTGSAQSFSSPADFVDAISDLSGKDLLMERITGTLSEYFNSEITNIGPHAFADCQSLISVNFPACTSIGNTAFYECSNLTSINFPVCKSIGFSAFNYCYSLTTANFPACTSMGNYAFSHCFRLSSVNFPVCSRIGSAGFSNCYNLTLVSFPACQSISAWAFCNCYRITSANLPVCTYIGSNVFYACYNLSRLCLGASSVCTLLNSNAFTSTPYTGYSASFSGTPYIYVPSSLIASYKAATNWTYFSSYISGI
jgi:hypothetical protein